MKQFHACWCRTSLVVLSILLGIATTGVAQSQQRPRTSGQRSDAPRRSAQQQQRPREQPALRQAANPRAAAVVQGHMPALRVPEVHAPRWLPLAPDHQNYIAKLLQAWEGKSAKIDRYQCEFTRWKYDLGFAPNGDLVRDADGREAASEIVKGVIKFEAPDKALFQVMESSEYSLLNPKAKKNIGPWRFDVSKSEYREVPLEEVGEHWVCDGQFFYEFAYHQKMLRKIPLPEESKGDAIARGPLPFLFRARADDINNRFWLRIVTPQGEKEAYHLEATPKSIEDSSQFGRVIIILDRKEFLPKALIIYPIGSRAEDDLLPGQPPQPPIREVFVFDDRKVNSKLEDLYFWKRSFHEPEVPKGWKLSQEPPFGAQNVVEQPQATVDEGISPAAALEAARNARRPR